jgi:hypothetical protein
MHAHTAPRRAVTASGALNIIAAIAAALFAPGCPNSEPSPPPDVPEPIMLVSDGTVSTVAGSGTAGFDSLKLARRAQLNHPLGVRVGPDAAVWIADFGNHRIRRVDLSTGFITTEAGDGRTSGPQSLASPTAVVPLADGAFLAVAWGENRVYRYAADRSRSFLAGNGASECAEPATQPPAVDQPLVGPSSADILADGSVLISEQGCHRVMRVRLDGTIAPYAGNGIAGYSGDGDAATAATLHAAPVAEGPCFGLGLSPENPPDELYVADTLNHVIREVRPFIGRILTFAGTGAPGYVDGPRSEAQFRGPTAVYTSFDHAVWIVDAGNHVIRRVDPLRTAVTTVLGTGSPGFNGDGRAARDTQLHTPAGIFVTRAGDVFVADAGNHRVRHFRFTEGN